METDHKRDSKPYHLRRVTRGGRGERLPCPFSKIGKKCPKFLKKNALIVVIYG